MTSFHDIARIVRTRHPRDLRLPRTALPHWPVRLLGPAFGLTQEYTGSGRWARPCRPTCGALLDHHEAWRNRRRQ